MAPSKQLCFHGPLYRPQNWSLPDSIIYSITKTPSNAKAWEKLIRSCKYFFFKNPIIVIDDLCFKCYKWSANLNIFEKTVNDLTNIPCKIWITNALKNISYNKKNYFVSFIIPKLFKCDVKELYLKKQITSKNEFLFLSSNVENITLFNTIVKNNDDEIVPLEKLVKALPKIKYMYFRDDHISSSITLNTVKELLKLSHFSEIKHVELYDLPEIFDIKTFFGFLKDNKKAKFIVHFRYTISEALKCHLNEIVNEIIETKNRDYKPPMIGFCGIERFKELFIIFHRR